MKRIFTGFAPFLTHATNPSWIVAQELAKHFGPDSQALELPVVFQHSFTLLKSILDKEPLFPDQLWLLGLAAQRSEICLERVALNWIETRYPDNQSLQPPLTQPIFEDSLAPSAIILKNHSLIDYTPAERESLNIKVSHSAGTYVCNDLYFRTLTHYQNYQKNIIFVHLPAEETLPLSTQIERLKNWIELVSISAS